MIVYFDSSSIVKWFFDESHAVASRNVRDQAEAVVTSPLSYPEVMSAIRRAGADGRCTRNDAKFLREEFHSVWKDFHLVRIEEPLIQRAGDLVFQYKLKGYDAMHLASALALTGSGTKIALFFSSFDRNLNHAAKEEGFKVHSEA